MRSASAPNRAASRAASEALATVESLSNARSSICDAFLIGFSVLVTPLLGVVIYRASLIGWQPLMTVQLLLVSAIWVMTALRGRLPYRLRAGFLVGFVILIAVSGIWSLGLMSAAFAALIAAPILSTVLFGQPGSLVVFVGLFIVTGAIGAHHVLSPHAVPPIPHEYLMSPVAWTIHVLGAAVFSGSVALAVGTLNRRLVRTIERSDQQSTALERSEGEFRRIIENIDDIYYKTDRTGRIVAISPSVETIVGYTADEVIGHQLADYYVDPPAREEFLARLREGGGVITGERTVLRHKDGSEVHLSTNAHTYTDPYGEVVGVEGLARDVTAQLELEEQLRQAQKMEVVGQLAGGIAHDFNNLLGVMLGNRDMMAARLEAGLPVDRHLDRMGEAIDRASALTQRLLGYSRRQILSPRATDVDALLGETMTMLRRALGETIEIELDVGEADEPHVATVDPHQLENAVLNLALNARDAMRKGGALRIEVSNAWLSAEACAGDDELQPGGYVAISVIDSGTGMSDVVRANAFVPFFTTKELGTGTGLGLSMVHGFAKQSGGHITLDSKVGRGTAVTIYLPDAREPAAREDDEPAVSKVYGGTERVLVVEDNVELRAIPATLLREAGYEVVEAGDGAQAIEQLGHGPRIDLLFTDMVLPGGMNGAEIAGRARVIAPWIKVLYTTGYAPESVLDDVAPRDADMFLYKPYSRIDLLTEVRAVLDSRGGGNDAGGDAPDDRDSGDGCDCDGEDAAELTVS